MVNDMNVRELIEELQKVDQEMPVKVSYAYSEYSDLFEEETNEIAHLRIKGSLVYNKELLLITYEDNGN